MKTFTTSKGSSLPILSLRGKDYLEVKYRLVWFREEKPHWGIETEVVSTTANSACAKATVRDEQGRVIATAHKCEDQAGFPDYLEKAETGAIGRALALIGYGTQFCSDQLDEGERIVDAPAARVPAPKSFAGVIPRNGIPYTKPNAFMHGTHAKRGYHEIGAPGVREWCDNAELRAAKDPAKAPEWLAEEIARARVWLETADDFRGGPSL